MEIKEAVTLSPYTTLGIGGPARYFTTVESEEDLLAALSYARENDLETFILGGGSNVLISDQGFDGLVIQPLIHGREVIKEDDEHVWLKVGAGEILDEVIAWSVENGWWGIENLTFVPGLVGALVIQNVNAYGAKAEHVVDSVKTVDLENNNEKVFTNEDCQFTYRHSCFNTSDKGKYVVTEVVLKLKKNGEPNISYVDLEKRFAGKKPSQADIREALFEIRSTKSQDWRKDKTAGSFFSNFLLMSSQFEVLEQKVRKNFGDERGDELREIGNRFYDPAEGGQTKIPAAWVLDKLLNVKGTKVGGAMISQSHALNVLNVDGATATDVMKLFRQVRTLVYENTGLELVNEPELVGFSEEELAEYFVL